MTPQTLAILDSPDPDEKTTREIREHGGIDDALALLPVFLAAPTRRSWLLPAISDLGDAEVAESLLDACVVDERLREDMPSELLHVLGRFGLAEAMLWHYAQTRDHYLVRDACLGLLHLPCASLPIADAIAVHEGKALFPEFLPCLAVKTGDRSWIRRLLAWGAHASTDCNGGLILGIAMFGDRAAFDALLWNPDWEATAGSTGTLMWTYAGARALGIDRVELAAHVRANPSSYATRVLADLDEIYTLRPWIGVTAIR